MKNNTHISSGTNTDIDLGLRSYMLQVYTYMSIGLFTSFVSAFLFSHITILKKSLILRLGMIPFLAPIALLAIISYMRHKLSITTARILFVLYSAFMGISMSRIFFVFSYSSITTTFLICAGMFAIMSIYGYLTKKNLLAYSSLLSMAVLGLFIALIINIFLCNQFVDFILSAAGVILFSCLIAYHTQKIKLCYYSVLNHPKCENFAIFSAIDIHTSFLNLFLFLLRLFGAGRSNRY